MNELPSLPRDPLSGSTLAYWSYGFDMPDDLGGGFVTGELLLRADGVLLRRQTLFFPSGTATSQRGSAHGNRSRGGRARPTRNGRPSCFTTAAMTCTSSILRTWATPAAGMLPANPPLTGNGNGQRQLPCTCPISVSRRQYLHPPVSTTAACAIGRIRWRLSIRGRSRYRES
jgi:hypothetical protein